MKILLQLLILSLFLVQCNSVRKDSKESSGEKHSEDLAIALNTVPAESKCQSGQYDPILQLEENIFIDEDSPDIKGSFQKTVYEVLSVVPNAVQSYFKETKSKIFITSDVLSQCKPEGFNSDVEGDIATCWKINPDGKSIDLFVSSSLNGRASTNAVSNNLILSLFQAFDSFFTRLDLSVDEDQGRFDFPSGLVELFNQMTVSGVIESGDVMPPEHASHFLHYNLYVFACGGGEKEDLKSLFPVTYGLIDQFFQLGPQIATNSQDLKLAPRIQVDRARHVSTPDKNIRETVVLDKPDSAFRNYQDIETGAKAPIPFDQTIDFQGQRVVREEFLINSKPYSPTQNAASSKGVAAAQLAGNLQYKEASNGLKTFRFIPDDVEPRMILGDSETARFNRDGRRKIAIFIHGTWAAHSPLKIDSWANPDSYLNKQMQAKHGGEMAAFQWGGYNTNESRMQGARILADHIDSLHRKGYKIDIYAHSHGGNVAIQAINMATDRLRNSGESRAGTTPLVHGLVTMGTPIRRDWHGGHAEVTKHINVFARTDIVQKLGSSDRWAIGTAGREVEGLSPPSKNVDIGKSEVVRSSLGSRRVLGHSDTRDPDMMGHVANSISTGPASTRGSVSANSGSSGAVNSRGNANTSSSENLNAPSSQNSSSPSLE